MSTEASNKQAEEQGEESILSTELAAELGGDVGTLVATKKKKGKKADGPTELVKMLAKQLSKKAQKRIDQIKRRKDTEARRSEFLDTIHEHEISDTHRQLLTSSREIGQAQTVRQLLSSIFRKQAAGLQLTQGEAQLLYRSGDADADFEFPPELLSSLSAGAGGAGAGAGDDDLWADGEGEGMEGVTGGASDLLFSFDDIIPPSERVEKGRKGKRRKSKKGGADESEDAATTSATVASSSASNDKSASASASASAPTCAPTSAPTPAPASVPTSTPASVGSSLLEQLKRLKEGRAPLNQTPADALAAVAAKVTAAVVKAAAVAEEMARVLPVRGPYQAEEIEIPVTELGEIRAARGKGEGGKIQVDRMQGTQGMQEQGREGIPSSRVWVLRSAAVQAARMELPVCAMEQEIVEAINCSKDDVIVLCGETGSGKSTQVPQFLYEAGYGQGGLIGITQPRRVAVTSTAARVAYEMSGEESVGTVGAGAGVGAEAVGAGETEGSKKSKKAKKAGKEAKDGAEQGTGGRGFGIGGGSIGGLVGHQIRFDKTTSLSTRIKFMTDGILLKEVASDLLLRKYRVVILDEAHERNINTDVLLGMLSRALPLRRAQALLEQVRYDNLDPVERSLYAEPLKPLKLIIMSATMRVEDFLNPRLFPTPPPVVRVNARQYPVTTHFSKRTETTNYLKETHRKVCQIHRKLPDGGVLVFLTGKKEILYMCHKLNKTLNKRRRLGVEGGVGVGEVEGGAGEVGMGDGEVEEGEEGLTGLGASAEELMEMEDREEEGKGGDDFAGTGRGVRGKGGKGQGAAGAGAGAGGVRAPVRPMGQEGIDSDSDSGVEDSDEEDSEGSLMEIGEEEEWAVEGSEMKGKEEGEGVKGGEVEGGESLRDKMLREVLGQQGVELEEEEGAKKGKAEGNSEMGAGGGVEEEEPPAEPLRAWILPLYAMMPAALQNRVFLPPPKGYRLIVVATNVAETSITIPGVRYVVDSGRQKERVFAAPAAIDPGADKAGGNGNGGKRPHQGTQVLLGGVEGVEEGGVGVARYEVRWVSQAGAEQRQGRAGRTGPGHCYRLYSANFFHQYLKPYQPPEITVTPLEELILQMKALGIEHVERFPFPTPPPPAAVRRAMTLLHHLGATARIGNYSGASAKREEKREAELGAAIAMATVSAMQRASVMNQKQLVQLQELQRQQTQMREMQQLTPLGLLLAKFPVNPRYAKILVMAYRAGRMGGQEEQGESRLGLLSHALTLVATLAERSVFEGGQRVAKKGRVEGGGGRDGDGEGGGDSDSEDGEEEEDETKAPKLFHHQDGDALARLRATGAYVYTLGLALTQAQAQDIKSGKGSGGKGKGEGETAGDIKQGQGWRQVQVEAQKLAAAAAESKSVRGLCASQRLHAPTLKRVLELRAQLRDICATVLLQGQGVGQEEGGEKAGGSDGGRGGWGRASLLDAPSAPPSALQETALRQLLLSGFCDSIARKAPLGVVKSGPRRRRITAYFSCHPSLSDVPLYLHPSSNQFRKDPTGQLPEYVLYSSLVQNESGDCTYMTCVTPIQARWLAAVASDCPLLKWGPPLESPAPSYDPQQDAVLCCSVPHYGAGQWELPVVRRPLVEAVADEAGAGAVEGTPLGFRKEDAVYRWFAKLLLEGSLFASSSGSGNSRGVTTRAAKELRGALNRSKLSDGSAALVVQMKPIPKVSQLLRKLVTRDVCTVAALVQQLALDPTFLSDEIQAFLVQEGRQAFRSAWRTLSGNSASAGKTANAKMAAR